MSRFKTSIRYLLAALCLVGLAGFPQAEAVETILDNWDLYQSVGVTGQGGRVYQVIVGWGLQEVGVTKEVSIMKSFMNVKGTMAISMVAGDLNNLASTVLVNQGAGNGTASAQSPISTNSVISDNVITNYSSVYKVAIGGGSFQDSNAVLALTQVSGNVNNISNIVAVSTQGAAGVSLSNASLSDVSASNNVYKNLGVTQASVEIHSDSFKGFTGVGSVIQTAGNFIQVNSQVSVKINQ
ncbi:MAG: hypothetical protein ACOZFS_01285 [Thermodesulfobacteriota bacterium]